MTLDQKEQIFKLRKEKYSYARIGRIFNISGQRVHQIITGYRSYSASMGGKSFVDLSLPRLSHYCQLCGKEAENVHHIDLDSSNNDIKNLLPLCYKCHTRVHMNPKQPLTSSTIYSNIKSMRKLSRLMHIYVDEETYGQIRRISQKEAISQGEVVRIALLAYLAKYIKLEK